MSENVELARLMLSIRQAGVSDERILSAMESVCRARFLSPDLVDRTYDDVALPIECDQTISQPSLVARMTAALDIGPRMRVLEIGTGSGYQAAILAKLCRRVYTVERHRPLMQAAEARFAGLGLHNITTRVGDGSKGWPEQAPFPRIIVTAAAHKIPEALLQQLEDGGIMIAPVGAYMETQMLVRIIRNGDSFETTDLVPVRFVPLIEGR